MTNKEFYFDKLLAVALENACGTFHRVVHGKNCEGKNCEDCEFLTVESIENWLNAEHVKPEPPLLKKGDDLKPGDWVMVRNDEDACWVKRRFMCYYEGTFITADAKSDSFFNHGTHSDWKQARLPEEDE